MVCGDCNNRGVWSGFCIYAKEQVSRNRNADDCEFFKVKKVKM